MRRGRRLTQGKKHCSERVPNADIAATEFSMHALSDLFTTDISLMSVASTGFMLSMGVFFVRCLLRQLQADADKAAAATPR